MKAVRLERTTMQSLSSFFPKNLQGFESPITRTEAYKILNVSPAASKEKVREAHRQLMLRNHPDNGGSNYVASKVNEAKDTLLK